MRPNWNQPRSIFQLRSNDFMSVLCLDFLGDKNTKGSIYNSIFPSAYHFHLIFPLFPAMQSSCELLYCGVGPNHLWAYWAFEISSYRTTSAQAVSTCKYLTLPVLKRTGTWEDRTTPVLKPYKYHQSMASDVKLEDNPKSWNRGRVATRGVSGPPLILSYKGRGPFLQAQNWTQYSRAPGRY